MNLASLDGMIKCHRSAMECLLANLAVVLPFLIVIHETHVEVPSHSGIQQYEHQCCRLCSLTYKSTTGILGLPE